MRNRILAIVAASAFISLTAVGTASADVVVSSSKVVSNGFTTCRSTRQTDIGPLGSASQRTKVCSSNLGGGVGFGGGGLGGVGFGGGGFGGGGLGFGGGGFGHHGGGIHINVHL
jgi:hypothetical protein